MAEQVKLDVVVNYINDNSSLKKQFDQVKEIYTKSFESQGFYNDPIKRKIKAEQEALKDTSKRIKEIISSYEKLNRKGQLSYLFETGEFTRRRKDQKRLNEAQFASFMEKQLPKETKDYFKEIVQQEKDKEKAKKREESLIRKQEREEERLSKEERKNEEDKARNINFERKWEIKRSILHSKALEENKKREEALRKKQWMLLLGKWGRFGVWGLIAQQALKYISKAVNFAYKTSMQGLDWQRTISGGAAGGTWFGQGLAAYQRAGIGANQYQGFKRGIQGYLGQVKLGMGNAAPLMYLGLSALGKPDELERQLERSLRRLPKDVSLALAGQMGLDYNMWEAIYSGRLDRQRSAYSEEAIQQWSELARGLNELITNVNTFFFNYLAPMAASIGEFLQRLSEGKTGIGQAIDIGTGYVSRAVKIALTPIEIVLKDINGNVVEKVTTDAYMEEG